MKSNLRWHKYFLISFNCDGRMNLLRASTLERLGDIKFPIIAITVHEELY